MWLHQKYKNDPEVFQKSIYKQNVLKGKHTPAFVYEDNSLVANSQATAGQETLSGGAIIPNSILKHKQQEYKLTSNGQLKVIYTNTSNHDLLSLSQSNNRRSNKAFRNTSLAGGVSGVSSKYSNQDLKSVSSPSRQKD